MNGSNNHTVNDLLTIGNEVVLNNQVFLNKFIFCYQANKKFPDTGTATCSVIQKYVISDNKVEIIRAEGTNTYTDPTVVRFGQGLAHILNYTNSSEVNQKRDYHPTHATAALDDLQLALWEYLLAHADDNIQQIFGIGTPSRGGSEQIYWNSKYGKGLGSNTHKVWDDVTVSPAWSLKALEIYEEASDIFNGTTESSLNAEMYVIENDKDQPLLMVKSTEKPTVNLTFKKEDLSGRGLPGVNITLSNISNISSISNTSMTSTGTDGNFGTITVTPDQNNGTFVLRVAETEPIDYIGIGYVDLTVNYNTSTGEVISIDENHTNVTSSGSTVIIKNKPKTKLVINKTDLDTGDIISGAEFDITIENVSSVKIKIEGQSLGNDGLINSNNGIIPLEGVLAGTISFEEIYGNGSSEDIKITLTETKAPKGYIIENPVTTILVKQDYSQYNVNNVTWENISAGIAVPIKIANKRVITLSGNVWEDGQTGEKGNVCAANGQKDSLEINLEGITVELYSVKDNAVIQTKTTDSNGNYLFTNIPKTTEGYKVRFIYDGVNYEETPVGTVSKPSELNREEFNNKFQTISAGKSNGVQELDYIYNSNNKTSVLNTNTDLGIVDASFQMSAETAIYTDTATDIHCGLVKRNFDLAISTDVKEATLKLNEEETKYSYAQIMNGELNKSLTAENIQDLEAYVTFSVILKEQTMHEANVREFVYYYDEAYEPYNIISTSDYTVTIDTEARKITFTSIDTGLKLTSENNYRIEINLTFKVNKDVDGNIIVDETATNIAEITSYYTYEGFIDKDSAPGNANIIFVDGTPVLQEKENEYGYEDDTDIAKGLKIALTKNETETTNNAESDDENKETIKNEKENVENNTLSDAEDKETIKNEKENVENNTLSDDENKETIKDEKENVENNTLSDDENKEAIKDEKENVENNTLSDDQNKEAIKDEKEDVKNENTTNIIQNPEFDLSLNKYVSKVVLTNQSGTTTYTYNNSQLAKVEISQKELVGTVLLVEYEIQVTNEGNVYGYVTEIIDYLPEGLEFNSEMNTDWYLGTDNYLHYMVLDPQAIEPGKTEKIKLVLTKTLKSDSPGIIENTAEIVESVNLQGIPEKDSKSNNKKDGEDDISKAELIISIKTGNSIIYIGIILTSIIILGAGIYLIDKKVIRLRK